MAESTVSVASSVVEQEQREAVDVVADAAGKALVSDAARLYADVQHDYSVGLVAVAGKCAEYVDHLVGVRQAVSADKEARNTLALAMSESTGSSVSLTDVLQLVKAHHAIRILALPDAVFAARSKGRTRTGWGKVRALLPLVESVTGDKAITWQLAKRADGQELGIEGVKALCGQLLTDGSSEGVIRERIADLLGKAKDTTEPKTEPKPAATVGPKTPDADCGAKAVDALAEADDLDAAMDAFAQAMDPETCGTFAKAIASRADGRKCVEAMLPHLAAIMRAINADKLTVARQSAPAASVNGTHEVSAKS